MNNGIKGGVRDMRIPGKVASLGARAIENISTVVGEVLRQIRRDGFEPTIIRKYNEVIVTYIEKGKPHTAIIKPESTVPKAIADLKMSKPVALAKAPVNVKK